jgi:hypothetical protein
MTFAGPSSENQRADIIAYLRTLFDNPLPPPTAALSRQRLNRDAFLSAAAIRL